MQRRCRINGDIVVGDRIAAGGVNKGPRLSLADHILRPYIQPFGFNKVVTPEIGELISVRHWQMPAFQKCVTKIDRVLIRGPHIQLDVKARRARCHVFNIGNKVEIVALLVWCRGVNRVGDNKVIILIRLIERYRNMHGLPVRGIGHIVNLDGRASRFGQVRENGSRIRERHNVPISGIPGDIAQCYRGARRPHRIIKLTRITHSAVGRVISLIH